VSLPIPKPGLVIRYSFLWSHEKAGGAAEGAKDRPCAIVVAARTLETGEIDTIVAPITHAPPDDPAASIEIPPATCKSLGLDSGRHWLRLDELNRFAWPGFDLRPLPEQPDRFDYGLLPRALFERLRTGILKLQQERRGRVIPRGEG
jgi:hypothetical protein